MKKEYLPIGSVVLLKNSKKRLMITGFYVKPNDLDVYFDYLGCIYPEGMISEHDNYVFNNEQISEVCYKGLVDDEENNFKAKLYEIIGKKETSNDNTVISIPVKLYEEYDTNNDIISIPLDKYNEQTGVISIPADLYDKALGEVTKSSNLISIPARLYDEYNENETGANVIRIPLDAYERENNKGIISIPYEIYKRENSTITIPLEEYEKLMNKKNVISINARTYEQFLEDEKGIISVPLSAYEKSKNEKMISIPLGAYERLKKREELISIPLNVYEKTVNGGSDKVISISLAEYERLTGGKEKEGTITIPSSVYDEILRKEKSNIEKKEELIEIPYDLYAQAVDNN